MFAHKGLTAMEARRRTQAGKAEPVGGEKRLDDAEDHGQDHGDDSEGDGLHHHEIHEREDGSAHSVHTHPDGHKEEADHASYEDALEQEQSQRGGEDGEDDAGEMHSQRAESPDGEPEDIAGMYSRDRD